MPAQYWIVSPSSKRAWLCIEAIKKSLLTVNEITDYVSSKRGFKVSDRIIYWILVMLRKKWYIDSTKQWKQTYWRVIKEVNGQIDIKL